MLNERLATKNFAPQTENHPPEPKTPPSSSWKHSEHPAWSSPPSASGSRRPSRTRPQKTRLEREPSSGRSRDLGRSSW